MIFGTFEHAVALAAQYHAGQLYGKGEGAEPYVLHCVRVAQRCSDLSVYTRYELMTVAVLHDSLEDTSLSEELLRKWFSKSVVDAIVVLTRNRDELYSTYLERVKHNATARQVKIADLMENLSKTTGDSHTMRVRREKYSRALEFLTQ